MNESGSAATGLASQRAASMLQAARQAVKGVRLPDGEQTT
jgi:hypothetical protein